LRYDYLFVGLSTILTTGYFVPLLFQPFFPPMSVAFLYPGQGAQVPGMLHRMPDHSQITATFEEAGRILGQDILELDTEQGLSSTVSVQLALLISGVASTKALQTEGIEFDLVAGLSVGAFAAAVSTGALAFKDALSLVKLRAELMEKAYPHGYGLSAVVGLNEQQLTKIVREINKPETPVFVANLNAPTQIVIAGSDAGMNAVLDRAKKEGARTAKRLPVSVPSHCALLRTVSDELTRRMAAIEIKTPQVVYMSNRRARALRDPESIREDLATNIEYPVRWHDAMTVAYERGIRLFVEMPPGRTLADLCSAAFPDARSVALEQTRIDSLVKLVEPP
jgi:malonate decarboxylase epsilon subunit